MANENETKRTWKTEIKKLMKEFKFTKNEINYVIKETKSEAKEGMSDTQMYNIAWRKFYAILGMSWKERRIKFAS